MILYYREVNGDFLAIDTSSFGYFVRLGRPMYEARATAIAHLVTSVCTCGVAKAYLEERCKRIAKAKVPPDWREAIGYHRR